ncbi:MAG: sensor histidine kinase [Thermoanaerobaculia bacterium]
MKAFSRISVRLLAFNLLLVFLPVMGFLYLDIYERQLLRAQERGMVQQGRLLAAALAAAPSFEGPAAEFLLASLEGRLDSRLRVVDRDGALLADSSRIPPRPPSAQAEADEGKGKRRADRDRPLYRIGAAFYRIYDRIVESPGPPLESAEFYMRAQSLEGPEVRAALDGRYGSTTRVSPAGQRSVTLYSAVPVRRGGEVAGAVLVSQSTYRILQDLYAVRLRLFRVFLLTVGVAALLSILVSTTIAGPLRRLRNEASAVVDRRGRLQGAFGESRRADEIGDLARALRELTRRLERHVRALEAFAADLSHELRNPLASIRTASEMAAEVDDPGERRRFREVVGRDVARMERMLSDVQDIAVIDARLREEENETFEVDAVLRELTESFRIRHADVRFRLDAPAGGVRIRASPDRVGQVFENLLANAASFSPAGGEVTVSLGRRNTSVLVEVADQGPGIPEPHLGRIFDRFFSYRPANGSERNGHSGLGLSIAAAIVEGYGGTIRARNLPDGGAAFEVRLPAA